MVASTNYPKSRHAAILSVLAAALRERRLCLVIGSGVSQPAGLPGWNELIEPLREELALPAPTSEMDPRLKDPLYIAEMFERKFGKPELRRRVVEKLTVTVSPSPTHAALAKLKVEEIFTTNFDQLMEKALEQAGKKPHVLHHDDDYAYRPGPGVVLVTKLHGDLSSPSRLILTKSDIFDYPRTHPNILAGFKEALKRNTGLFVGTSMRDPNMEWIFESALRDLKDNARRHYIFVEDWDENLREYYRYHGLDPIALDSWDKIPSFLEELREKAEQREEEPVPTGLSTDAIPADYVKLVAVAKGQLADKFRDLAERFNKGSRETLKPEAEQLLEKLEPLDKEKFAKLRVRTLLLLARIAVHSEDRKDLSGAAKYLDSAENLSVPDEVDELKFLKALLKFRSGEPEQALKLLDEIDPEQAAPLRLGILSDLERFDECRDVIQAVGKNIGDDLEWDCAVANVHMKEPRYERAWKIMEPWITSEAPQPPTLQAAGSIRYAIASSRFEAFCKEYNIFEHLFILLMHHQLIDPDGIREAADYFDRAGAAYEKLGEKSQADECFERRDWCRSLRAGIDFDLGPGDEADVYLDRLFGGRSLQDLRLQDFHKLLENRKTVIPVLLTLKQWSSVERAYKDAAQVIEDRWEHGVFDTFEFQIAATYCLVELWHMADQPSKARTALERLNLPEDFAHYTNALEILHLFMSENVEEGQALLDRLERKPVDSGKDRPHPLILALICDYAERSQDWQRLLDAGRKLVSVIPIRQSFVFVLTALGKLQRDAELLQVLRQAEDQGIKLPPAWTHVNRARALLASNRDDEAKEVLEDWKKLSGEQGIKIDPVDRLNLVDAYVRTGDRANAKKEAVELIRLHPHFEQGHLALMQLHWEQGEYEDAFRVIQRAAREMPDSEQIQAQYIIIGFHTGHGEEVREPLQTFSQRFPESNAIRLTTEEEAWTTVKDWASQNRFAQEQYENAKFPGLRAAYASTLPSFLHFWHRRMRSADGIYIANGDQTDDWRELRDLKQKSQSLSVVIDFSALLTAFELDEALRESNPADFTEKSWSKLLQATFEKALIPTSFRRILIRERQSLAEHVQVKHLDSLRKLRDRIDTQFEIIPFGEETRDILGNDTERNFAKKENLYYLNEYAPEKVRLDREIGLQQLGDHLAYAGDLTKSQQRKLDTLAGKVKAKPLPREKSAVRRIVADVMTLNTLQETGLLDPVVRYFDTVYVSEQGKQWLLGELESLEFSDELRAHFDRFDKYLGNLGDWLEYVKVNETDRIDCFSDTAEGFQSELHGEPEYFFEMLTLSWKGQYALLTDDRVTRIMQTTRVQERTRDLHGSGDDEPRKIRPIGSDTLLRYWYHEKTVDKDRFVEEFERLIEWRYLHLPLDSEFLLALVPEDENQGAERLDRAITYYRNSLKEFDELAATRKYLLAASASPVVFGHQAGVSETIFGLHKMGRSADYTSAIFNKLSANFILTRLSGRRPETLFWTTLKLSSLIAEEPGYGDPQKAEAFLQWLDKMYQGSGLRPDEIDLSWQIFFEKFATDGEKLPPDSRQKEGIGFLVAYLLSVLLDRSLEFVFASPVRTRLEKAFGLDLTPGLAHTFRTANGEDLSITDRQLTYALEKSLSEGIPAGGSKTIVDETRIEWFKPREDSFLAGFRFSPSELDPETLSFPRQHVVFLDLLRHEDGKIRMQAWNTGKKKLERWGIATSRWDKAGEKLKEDQRRTWTEGADQCLDILMSQAPVASDILVDVTPAGYPAIWTFVHELKPHHVCRWLGWDPEAIEALERFQDERWKEFVGLLCPDTAPFDDQMRDLRRFSFYSMFPDARIARKRLQSAVVKKSEKSRSALLKHCHKIVEEAFQDPSPLFKINTVLTVVELSSQVTQHRDKGSRKTRDSDILIDADSFWGSRKEGGSTKQLHRLMKDLLADALEDWPSRSDEEALNSHAYAIHAEFTEALFSTWHTLENGTSRISLRYLSLIGSGYLLGRLVQQEVLAAPRQFRWFRNSLVQLIDPFADRSAGRGFFRVSLWDWLAYHIRYAVKGLSQHIDIVSNYLSSDVIRSSLLKSAGWSKVSYLAAGGVKTFEPMELDNELNIEPAGGVDDFLRKSAGNSLKYWDKYSRESLNILSAELDVIEYLDAALSEVRDESESPPEPDSLLMIGVIKLGIEAERTDWDQWVKRLFEVADNFGDSMSVYEQLLDSGIAALLSEILREDTKKAAKQFIFQPPDKVADPPEKLRLHAKAAQVLLRKGHDSERLDGWLKDLARDQSIPFQLRRDLVGEFINVRDALKPELASKLGVALKSLAADPEWRISEILMLGHEE